MSSTAGPASSQSQQTAGGAGSSAALHRYEFVGACESILATSGGCSHAKEDLHSLFDFLARAREVRDDRERRNATTGVVSGVRPTERASAGGGSHADHRSKFCLY